MQIEIIETKSLGNRGYLIHDGRTAIALDVQRDYQRWIDRAADAGVTISHVFETHMHNDYLTGGFELAKQLHAAYVVPAGSDVRFEARMLGDNESVEVGAIRVTGLHTPGHTEHHMSFLMTSGDRSAVFTGGGVLYGTVGRTDLVSTAKTDELTAAQYDSARRLGDQVPDDAAVYPTHGFGSFCSSSAGSGVSHSTVADEKRTNIAFTSDRESFISQLLAGLGPYPAYYAHMGPLNQAGPGAVKPLHLHDYSAEAIARRLGQETKWVIDIRSRTLFAAHHPAGAVGIELGDSFATYCGWIIPWSDGLLLVGDSEAGLRTAYTELSRIGMEQFVEGATDDMHKYLAAGPDSEYRVSDFDGLKSVMADGPYVLDVRQVSEWQDGHIPGSHNIPLHELPGRLPEIPQDQDIWVHCGSGNRAGIAASLLDAHRRRPVLIDDSFESAAACGLTHTAGK